MEKGFFDVLIKKKEETYEIIVEMEKNYDYTTSNLLDYGYFSNHYTLIAIDLSKQTELENPDLKQQINFMGRIEKNEGPTRVFIIEKSEETTLDFSKRFCNLLFKLFIYGTCIKTETQKIVNLLNDTDKTTQNMVK